ncbi:hypothetical protein JAAARDRAFT_31449 [Jaapia argillacea MUCL 33604]|uniref:Uncharacterized protein n=1 Tax=Jaapia argillacea MUCL 33604 TaxID=933084 RepID=A0A067QEQ0_9AGAM|nr:hypothetical protein JAAARDRAFT_31449 [Jaapia argillacea MUCL 33604]
MVALALRLVLSFSRGQSGAVKRKIIFAWNPFISSCWQSLVVSEIFSSAQLL